VAAEALLHDHERARDGVALAPSRIDQLPVIVRPVEQRPQLLDPVASLFGTKAA
jgi:hypothetical protein